MPKETLTIDSMGNIDAGSLRIAVNNALKLLTQDLSDRPVLDKPRTLILKIDMKPIVDTNSNAPALDSVDFAWNVMTKAPAIGSTGGLMKPNHEGLLYFHSDLPDAPDDETIMDQAARKRRDRGERNQ